MFRLQVKKKLTAFFAAANMTFRVDNPAFDTGFIYRKFANSILLPDVGNTRIFGHAGSSNALTSTLDATVYLGGMPLDHGVISVKTKTENGFSVAFQNKEIGFLEKLGNIKINEICDTLDYSAGFAGIRLRPQTSFPGSQTYSLNIRGTSFSHTQNSSANQSALAAEALVNQINTVFPNYCRLVIDTIVIDNYIQYPDFLVKNDAVSNSFTILNWETPCSYIEPIWRDFATNSVLNGNDNFAFPQIYNPLFYGDKNEGYKSFSYVNYFNANSFTQRESGGATISCIVPFLKYRYILKKIAEKIGIDSITIKGKTEIEDLIIVNLNSFDYAIKDYHRSPFSSGTLGVVENFVSYMLKINLNECVPDISASNFILNLCKDFDLKAVVYDRVIVLEPRTLNYNRKPIDLTAFAKKDYTIEQSLQEGYTISYLTETEDTQIIKPTDELGNYVFGEGKYTYQYSFNTLPNQIDSGQPLIVTPSMNQIGTSSPFGLTGKINKLRILHYKGFKKLYPSVPNSNGYGYASNEGTTFNLKINGTNGLFETFLKYYIEYLVSSKKMRKQLRMPIGLLLSMLKDGIFNVHFQHRKGDVSGVIKEMSITCDNESYGYADVQMDVWLK